VRAPLPAHLPRDRVVLPGPTACPCCGGRLSKLGEDITETLEVEPLRWKVVQTVRERLSCRSCETVTQPPAPFHPIARGRAGPNLLAMILEAKFGQHLPLNRQSESYAMQGVELSVSTIADWVGTSTANLAPLTALIDAHVLAAARLHGDDTTVPVLARGKTITGRVWAYVRDDRPFGGPAPPAVMFRYSRDRTAEHPNQHLAGYGGILQADAYAGYNARYEPDRKPGPITEAACWTHGRRKLFELAEVARAPLAVEAVRRIDAIFAAERAVNGLPAAGRLAVRQHHTTPLVAEFEAWMRESRGKLSRHSPVAKAMDDMLTRWEAFTRFLGEGRICLTNNAAERALRGVAMVRSLYPSSSSLWKHCDLVFWRRLTRAAFALDRLDDPHVIEVGGLDLIGRARHDLRSRQHAGLDQPTDTVGGDAVRLCGFGQREPLSVFVRGSISVDASDAPNRADPMRRPRLALSSRQPHPV
jgi:transposase